MLSNKFKGLAVAAALGVSLVSGNAMAGTATATVEIDTTTELKIVWQGDLNSFNSAIFVDPVNWNVLGFFTNVSTKTIFGSSTTVWESAVQARHAVPTAPHPHDNEAELGRIYTAYFGASMGGSGSDSKMDVHPPMPGDNLQIMLSPANFTTPHWDHYSYTVTSNVDGTGTATLYALHPVPEPESYAMLLAGLGLLGFMAKRRSRA